MSQPSLPPRDPPVLWRVVTSFVGAAALAPLLLFSACRDDMPTAPPASPLAPTPADLTLTGGIGTPIFPNVTPGERQPTGDARGLNASGGVTGGAFELSLSGDADAYRWTPASGAVRIAGCCDSQAGNDINDAGTVVGITQSGSTGGSRGFVAAGTTMTTLPLLPGGSVEQNSTAVAINNVGQIVGTSPAAGGAAHATLWSPSLVALDLGTLGGAFSRAIDINASGQVIGWSLLPGDATSSFFLWSAGSGMQNLATINSAITSVVEINDAGQIIGQYVAPNGQAHAFLYTPGSGLRDLGTLGGTASTATGLNQRGDVVGSSTLADNTTHAFLWTAADGMEDITALSGVTDVRRLNDDLQTLGGASATDEGIHVARGRPQLVQLQITQSNEPPTALFTVECSALTCVLDARGSLDDKPGLTYSWDLNKYPDGSATGDVVTVTYPHGGMRYVTLTVTDANGLSNSITKSFDPGASVPPNQAPVASFTFSCSNLTCSFDATSSSDDHGIVAYTWDLNKYPDGSASGAMVTTTYPHSGIRYVTLTVTDADGASTMITKSFEPSVNTIDAFPVARFTSSCSGTVCTLDASTSSDDVGITSYAWSLGKYPDNEATGVTVTTDYWHTSTRTVTLTVTDTKGQTNSVTKTVNVP